MALDTSHIALHKSAQLPVRRRSEYDNILKSTHCPNQKAQVLGSVAPEAN
jgi:hypothetical protein